MHQIITLEVHTKVKAQDRGVRDALGAIRVNNVLDDRLHVSPLIQLDSVIEFQHLDIIGLIDIALLLLEIDVVDAEIAIGQRDTELVLVAGRDETLVNQAGLKIEGHKAVAGWRKLEQAEEIETLVAKLRLGRSRRLPVGQRWFLG